MIQVYHNPRCSKSRCALDFLKQKQIEFEVISYLDSAPDLETFRAVIKKLGIKPIDLIRKNEELYKNKFKQEVHSDEEWMNIMLENPKLIERPIVINGEKAVVARPTDVIETIL